MKMVIAFVLIGAAGWIFVRVAAKQRAGAELARLRTYRESHR